MATPEQFSAILKDEDRCIRCGLCLSVCPTYRESLSETASPRGRVALAAFGVTGPGGSRRAAVRRHLPYALQQYIHVTDDRSEALRAADGAPAATGAMKIGARCRNTWSLPAPRRV